MTGRTESYRNLSMNSYEPNYAVTLINGRSDLVEVSRIPFTFATADVGTSTSGPLLLTDLQSLDLSNADETKRVNRIACMLNGEGPFEFDLSSTLGPFTTLNTATLDTIALDIKKQIETQRGASPGVTAPTSTVTTTTPPTGTITITANTDSTHPAERSSIRFFSASRNNAATVLKLGVVNGGIEIDAAAKTRPAQTGIVGATPTLTPFPPAAATGEVKLNVYRGAATAPARTPTLTLWGGTGTPPIPKPQNINDVVAELRAALAAKATDPTNPEPLLTGATVSMTGGRIRVSPSSSEPLVSFEFADAGTTAAPDTTATALGLTGTNARNVARYVPGSVSVRAQSVNATTDIGNNGTAPTADELRGSASAPKKGIYALDDVDIFNLLVIPEATMPVQVEAIRYCVSRRAFMIIDAPDTLKTLADAQKWIEADASPIRAAGTNSAMYFPLMKAPDALRNNLVQPFKVAGAMAGVYARTDAERGVWKAPAGTAAAIVGATGLTVTLTDLENGVLNPKGLNCLRTFPVIGTVAWGARTARGADQLADEYKYIPVRRLALFLEESLYRGSQWAVFEPNDEPLWAQIRLNFGAFMHNLFAQGAFKGQTARDAYFVKCDKETTTQNDIDLGRVNIVVGFAPLKPAEFVIIKIQQIAGQIQT